MKYSESFIKKQIPKIKKYIKKYNLTASDIMLISEIAHNKKSEEELKFKSDKKIKFFDWVGFITAIQTYEVIDESNISTFFVNHNSIKKSENKVAENKVKSQESNKEDIQSEKQAVNKKQTKTLQKAKLYSKSEISDAEIYYSKHKLKKFRYEAEFILFKEFIDSNRSKLKKPNIPEDVQEKIDAILDKNEASGYYSLSKEEKDYVKNWRKHTYLDIYYSDKGNIEIRGSVEKGFEVILKKVFIREKGLFKKYKQDVIEKTYLHPKNLFKDNYVVESKDEEYLIKEFQKLKNKYYKIYFEFLKEKRLTIGDLRKREKKAKKEAKRREAERKRKEAERKRKEALQTERNNILKKLDKDGNGLVDIIENDDFMKLLKKHQKKIIEVDKKHIQDFVKISNYLKTKEDNIQKVFKHIKETESKSEFKEYVKLLENQIHTYNILLHNSLSMIIALNEDLTLFYQLYEAFDKLNIFNSNWQNEVSNKLDNIEVGLNSGLRDVMYSINDMEYNITQGLNQLNQSTREGFKNLNTSISRELKSIDSSIRVNNLFTAISTYQLYKINKQTKGLNN